MKKLYISALSLVLCLVLCIVYFISDEADSQNKISVNAVAKYQSPDIVIDAGHGGEDSGTLSAEGLAEKEVNLDISLTLEKILKLNGFNTIMIRTEDCSVHSSDATTTRERKVSDIHHRVESANSSENNILVSIHQNHFSESKYSGAQVFYSKNNSDSPVLAEKIRVSVTSLLQTNNTRQCKESSGVYLLDNATVPAVIVECGFLSNPEEAKLLSDSAYRDDMAYSIFLGILEYCYLNR